MRSGVIGMKDRPHGILNGFGHARLYLSLVGLLVVASLQLTANQVTAASRPNCAFDVTNGDVYGYRVNSDLLEEICVLEHSRMHPEPKIVSLPGTYSFEMTTASGVTSSWSVIAKRPGVYRFFSPVSGGRQFVVWWPSLGVTKLMEYFSYLYTHGNRDDHLNADELIQLAKVRRISVTCGTVSRLLQQVLTELKIKSRIVQSITTRTRNGLDDGHVLLEVWSRKRWTLFDPDSRTMFGSIRNQLGVADLQNGFIPKVGVNITQLGPPLTLDHFHFVTDTGVDLAFLEERSRISASALEQWYLRVLGRIGVESGGEMLFVRSRQDSVNALVASLFPSVRFVSVKFLKSSP